MKKMLFVAFLAASPALAQDAPPPKPSAEDMLGIARQQVDQANEQIRQLAATVIELQRELRTTKGETKGGH